MSSSANTAPRRHRHTSAAKPSTASSSQNPQNPQQHNHQAHTQISQPEMDVSTVLQQSSPATPPQTPRKDPQAPQQPNSSARENASKPRSKNKNRPKNVMTSPPAKRSDRITPPLKSQSSGNTSAKPTNTPSAAAYAGTTFHASPAPSTLPIPSFYSKSVPDSPAARNLKTSKVPAASTPSATVLPKPQFQREESPLDLFFKADREEKARARSTSAAQTNAAAGPFPPPGESPRHNQTPPCPGSLNRNRPGHSRGISSSGMFSMELDGDSDSGTSYGPAFSTPYAERINAARNPSTKSLPKSSEMQQATDRSEALKAYLFSGHAASTPALVSQPNGAGLPSPSVSSGHNAYPTPTTPSIPLGSRGLSSRSAHYAQIYGANMTTPNDPSRVCGRASGLRQEVAPSKSQNITPSRHQQYTAPSQPMFTGDIYGLGQPNQQSGSPAAHVNSSVPKTLDLRSMEDELRNLLKMNGSGVSGITQNPSASASVPNYVGGSAPPMNGMHNGVMGS